MSNLEQTLSIIKPDAVERNLENEIKEMFKSNISASELHNNCAGKHLAMLSGCKINKFNLDNYLDINHPHQVQIRKIFSINPMRFSSCLSNIRL